MRYNKIKLYKFIFWSALLASYILAVIPLDKAPVITPFSDKGNHFIAFAFLTVALFYAYRLSYIKISLWMFAYAVWIEFSQLFIPNRYGELLDIVADVVGIVIGILISALLRHIKR